MAVTGADVVWEELGKVDYLLDQLARAVERGELPRESYDRLAPRYLARRGELAAILERRAGRLTETIPAAEGTLAAVVGSSAAAQAARPEPLQLARPAPKPVPWTTVLTFLGAFLVVVASAIFAVATWEVFPVEFKLLFLGVLTVGFYGVGHIVRTRFGLASGGVALLIVGSAMLLLDGWIAIDGYGLEGPWPWVGWLAVCSGVYWFTETRIAGKYFGAMSAAAQVVWWWLLADGLGFAVAPRFAWLSVVAVVWTFVALAPTRQPFAPLATVLRWAAPVLAAFSVVAIAIDQGVGPVGWRELLSALVAATAVTVIAEANKFHPGAAALAHVPVFFAFASMIDATGTSWAHVALLVAMAIAYLAHELLRGGWGHGVLAVVAELAAWFALADVLDASPDVTVALIAGVGASWVVAAHLLAGSRVVSSSLIPAANMRAVAWIAEVGGWTVLAAATLAMPLAREVLPLSGTPVAGRDVLLALWVFGLWCGCAALRRHPVPGLASVLISYYVAAAALAWAWPELHSATYATGLLAIGAVWVVLRGPAGRLWRLDPEMVGWFVRATHLVVVIGGLLAAEYHYGEPAWQISLLLGAGAVLWLADSTTSRSPRIGLVPSAVMLVFAVQAYAAYRSGWSASGPYGAGTACVAAALGAVAGLRFRPLGDVALWSVPAAAAGTAAALFAATDGDTALLSASLALATLAWVLSAVSWHRPEVAAPAALTGVLALFTLFDAVSAPPVTTVAVSLAVAALLLVPEALSGGIEWLKGTARVAAFAGIVLLVGLTAVGAASPPGVSSPVGWADIGDHGLAAAMLALSAYAFGLAVFERVPVLQYLGGAFVLLAYFVEVTPLAGDAAVFEYYTVPTAFYLVWCGYRWARALPGVAVPFATDLGAVLVGLGASTVAALTPFASDRPYTHLIWALGLATVAIAAGIAVKARVYFFGGVSAIVILALVRSILYLAQFLWAVLLLLGVVMLVVALTWERQRRVISATGERMRDTFLGWR